jgi:DNA topoisomerase-1
MIVAKNGRYGPYVSHDGVNANLPNDKTPETISLNEEAALIEEKKLNPGKGRRFGADPGKQLGEHPQKGGMIVAKNGRYGPYVSHNGVNANLPNDKTPETITLDEAVGLIDARAESGAGSSARRKRPARGAPAKKAAAPKTVAAKGEAAKPKKRAAASTAKAPRKSKKPIEAAE